MTGDAHFQDPLATLMKAIVAGAHDEVQSLLQSGAEINTFYRHGFSPLRMAVEQDNLSIVTLLLNAGADINLANKDGFTALHQAVDYSIDGTIQTGGQPGDEPTDMIDLLLRHGASLSAQDQKGRTPLDLAMSYGSEKIVSFLDGWGHQNDRAGD